VKKPRQHGIEVSLLLGLATFSAAALGVHASGPGSGSDEITAVSSKVYNGYVRTRLAGGAFRPESFVFGNGGFLTDGLAGLRGSSAVFTRDDTIDEMTFPAVARMIKGPLEGQGYVLAGDPGATSLFIMVFWGRTIGTNAFLESGLSNVPLGSSRDKMDLQNAALLGFDSERVFGLGFDDPTNMMSNISRQAHSGVVAAVEDDRYYVILRAFDFQSAWKQKTIRLLWETRFSLSQRRHDFGEDLPRMTQIAAKYFGQDTHGLIIKAIPEGHVEMGEPRSLGDVPGK
jgi:hypothetical protein